MAALQNSEWTLVFFAPNTQEPSSEQVPDPPRVQIRVLGVRRTWNCAGQCALRCGMRTWNEGVNLDLDLTGNPVQSLWQYCLDVNSEHHPAVLICRKIFHRKTIILLIGFSWMQCIVCVLIICSHHLNLLGRWLGYFLECSQMQHTVHPHAAEELRIGMKSTCRGRN